MAGSFRVLVTGSRDWGNSIMIRAELDAVCDAVLERPGGSLVPCILVHGACPSGADAMVSAWCRDRAHALPWYLREEPHPADWRPDGVLDKAAGFRRNAHMVSLGASVMLAFIMPCADLKCRRPGAHGSHGASHCAQLAEASGILTRRFEDNG
jgi:YspA, cpYpsA-related SLOG family